MTRIALVHDWLTGMRGGEKCLEAFCQIWPNADIYTLIHRPGSVSKSIERLPIYTSRLQQVPGVHTGYRYLLPLMPIAIESFDLAGYDLVVSLSHCVAKSVQVPGGVPHICYCFTPMRYAWHQRAAYFGQAASGWTRAAGAVREILLADLRRWDSRTSSRVSRFIAISRTVQRRIRECYGRESDVIFPPVDVQFFTPGRVPREDFYLCVSALVPYKRIDLAVEACRYLDRRLIVIGSGPGLDRLRAAGDHRIQFLGWQPDQVIRDHYRRCRAVLFPGEEDFGIVPVEAQACGTPVIAYGSGGAAETVIGHRADGGCTGHLFARQTAESLAGAIIEFETHTTFSARAARANAEQYGTDRFVSQIKAYFSTLPCAARAA